MKDIWSSTDKTLIVLAFLKTFMKRKHSKVFEWVCSLQSCTDVLEGKIGELLEIGGFLRACLIYFSLGPLVFFL